MVLNYIWVGFFLIAFLVGVIKLILFYTGFPEFGGAEVFPLMMKAAFDMSKASVLDIALPLVGIITLWLGLMKVGEKSGMVGIIARLIGPFFHRIFPDIPRNHPVVGHILMNFSANMLNLDNAATPLGLKAMQGMQELNPDKDTASNAQIMFLVLNTSGLTIIPVSIMANRATMGATDPSDIFIPLLIATFCSSLVGLIFVGIKQRINFLDKVLLAYLGGLILFIAGVIYYFTNLPQEKISPVSSLVSNLFLFTLIVSFIGLGIYKKINVFESFIEGAKEGFEVAVKIIPYLVGILVGVAVFRVCGALDFLVDGIGMFFSSMGFDTRFIPALPTGLIKPMSGSGARAVMMDTMQTYGADSFAGTLSSIFQGAADTTFYIIAVYFGAVGIKRTRYAITGGLIADFAGIVAAIWIAYIFFGNRP